jgi:hypothetical protein
MSTLRLCCALGVALAMSASRAEAQGYAAQGYDQQQYQQQPQYQQPQPQPQTQPPPQYQQPYPQQQPPPGYFPTPDAQGSYGYQQQYAPNGAYPGQQPAPGQEGAEPAPLTSVKGAIQLGAGIALLQHDSLSYSQTSAPVTAPVAPGAPPAAGPTQPWPVGYNFYEEHPFSLEAGYGLSHNILLGAIVQLSSGAQKIDAGGVTAAVNRLSFTFAPKLDYQFSPTSRWNPFLGAALSLTLNNKRFGPATDSMTLFGAAVRGGFRIFILDQLSVDPTVSLGYRTGSGTQTTEAVPTPIEFKNSISNLLFAVSLGVSLWIK